MPGDIKILADRDDILFEVQRDFNPTGPAFEPNTGANERNQMGREMIEWVQIEFGLDPSSGLLAFSLPQLRVLRGYVNHWQAEMVRMDNRLASGSQGLFI